MIIFCISLEQVANRMIGNGHFARDKISAISSQLARSAKDFARCLEERTAILGLSATFFSAADNYMKNAENWSRQCEQPCIIPTDLRELEEKVHQSKKLVDTIYRAYNDVINSSRKLCVQLNHFINFCSQCDFIAPSSSFTTSPVSSSSSTQTSNLHYNSSFSSASSTSSTGPTPTSSSLVANRPRNSSNDYSEATKHVQDLTHRITAHYRRIEIALESRRNRLHLRFSLALFNDDVHQVMEWINTCGESMLTKSFGIGKSLETAQELQKNHLQLESYAQNTYNNVEKLRRAASEFSRTGECDPEEIFRIRDEMVEHAARFKQRIERRRRHLEMGIAFFEREKDLTLYFEDIQNYHRDGDKPTEAPKTLTACETSLDQIIAQRENVVSTILPTINEGETLLSELKALQGSNGSSDGDSAYEGSNVSPNPPSSLESSIQAIENSLENFKRLATMVEELWNDKKFRMELCLQLRLFEKDAANVVNEFQLYKDEVRRKYSVDLIYDDITSAETALQDHNDLFSSVQRIAFDTFHRGENLIQVYFSFCYQLTEITLILTDTFF